MKINILGTAGLLYSRKTPQVPHSAQQVACHSVNNSKGKGKSIPPQKTRRDSLVHTLQVTCDPSQIWRGPLRFLPAYEMRPLPATLCRPLLLLPSIFPSIRVFSNELALHIRWPKHWSFIGFWGEHLLTCTSIGGPQPFPLPTPCRPAERPPSHQLFPLAVW